MSAYVYSELVWLDLRFSFFPKFLVIFLIS
jgi:hypothetical protein